MHASRLIMVLEWRTCFRYLKVNLLKLVNSHSLKAQIAVEVVAVVLEEDYMFTRDLSPSLLYQLYYSGKVPIDGQEVDERVAITKEYLLLSKRQTYGFISARLKAACQSSTGEAE